MKIFHHDDHDGLMSGAIALRKYGPEAELYKIHHGITFPFEVIDPGETVVIVDFAVNDGGGLERLCQITDNVIWIDHHISAIERDREVVERYRVDGLLEIGRAACVLAWEYFFPGEQLPLAVALVGDHDVWTFAYGDQTRFFQAGLYLHKAEAEDPFWQQLLDEGGDGGALLAEICREGATVRRFQQLKDASDIRRFGYETDFAGFRCVACNVKSNSYLFSSLEYRYPVMISYAFDGTAWKCSLFTERDDIDVSKIAARFGGGGHAQAAGFRVEQLPFEPAGPIAEFAED